MAAEAAAAAAAPGSSLSLRVSLSTMDIGGPAGAHRECLGRKCRNILPRWEGETGTNLDTVASACFSSVDRRGEDRPGEEGECATSSKKRREKSPPSPKE